MNIYNLKPGYVVILNDGSKRIAVNVPDLGGYRIHRCHPDRTVKMVLTDMNMQYILTTSYDFNLLYDGLDDEWRTIKEVYGFSKDGLTFLDDDCISTKNRKLLWRRE